MFLLVNIVASCILIISSNDAAKILAVFPVPSISHQVVFRPLTQELARRGHEVTVITTDPVPEKADTPPNLKEIDVHDISYDIWKEIFITAPKGQTGDVVAHIKNILYAFAKLVDAQLKAEEVKSLIYNKKNQFDLLMIEACIRPALVFSHIYKDVPVIMVASLGALPGNYEVIGAPVHPILHPNVFRHRIHNLTFWEKVTVLYNHYQLNNVYNEFADVENSMLQQHFGPDIPSVDELGNNVDMLFLNVNPIFEGIRPVPPSVVYMGGLHLKLPKELPTAIKSYLDSSKHGVVYISFGTNVVPSALPPERIAILTKVFSELPYDVLWKWDKDELPGRSDNIKISKWLPQPDILRHPKLKVFVTQGGLQSTDEAIVAGVPLIGFPMLGDQWFNIERYVYLKIGIKLDIETFTEEQFKDAIKTVIEDDSYRQNIKKLRSLMLDTPQQPLERAVWWTEHVLRHGGAKHLRSPAANISWARYLELELVLTLLAGLAAIATIVLVTLYALHKHFASAKKQKFN